MKLAATFDKIQPCKSPESKSLILAHVKDNPLPLFFVNQFVASGRKCMLLTVEIACPLIYVTTCLLPLRAIGNPLKIIEKITMKFKEKGVFRKHF